MDTGLDAMTRAKLEDLATAFHQSRAAVLRHVMRWGLGRRWTGKVDQHDLQGPVRHGFVYVEFELYQHVQETAIAAVPRTAMRSHDSRTYDTRFMRRLDLPSQIKLHDLVEHFGVSKAEVIRQLIVQANAEDFPESWQMKAAERRAQRSRRDGSDRDEKSRP
jgi:hypothetical protein